MTDSAGNSDGQRIELDAVCKSYGTQLVLDRAAASISPGEFVAVVGRSGSGKSTLLKLIGGLNTPDSGSIRHGEQDLAQMSESELTLFRRRELGFVFQFFNLVPTLTVSENVQLPLALNRVGKSKTEQRSNELLGTLGLSDCADRLPDQLSGGEQQRVAIARALAHEPNLVVTDEPTGNLDPTVSEGIFKLFLDINRSGTSIFMATHNHNFIGKFPSRVLKCEEGRILDSKKHKFDFYVERPNKKGLLVEVNYKHGNKSAQKWLDIFEPMITAQNMIPVVIDDFECKSLFKDESHPINLGDWLDVINALNTAGVEL